MVMRNGLLTLGLIVAIPLLILCIPIIIPYVAISQRLQRRRLARTPCPECGTPFGYAEVDRARDACQESTRKIVADIMARGGRPRIVAMWHLRCPACDAQFTFAPSTNNLNPIDTETVI